MESKKVIQSIHTGALLQFLELKHEHLQRTIVNQPRALMAGPLWEPKTIATCPLLESPRIQGDGA